MEPKKLQLKPKDKLRKLNSKLVVEQRNLVLKPHFKKTSLQRNVKLQI